MNHSLNLAWETFITGDFQQRWDAAKILVKSGEEAIDFLTPLLEDDTTDVDLRCEAAQILGQLNLPRAFFFLATMLETVTDSEVIAACSQALAKNGKAAIAPLSNALVHPDTRLAAVQALAYLHQPEIISPLLSVVNDEHPEVRKICIQALSNFHDSRIHEVLIKALQDTNPQVRKEAVIGFRQTKLTGQTLVQHLTPLLYDFNFAVCVQTSIALGKIATPEAIASLDRCLQSPLTPSSLRREIVRALNYSETLSTLSLLTNHLTHQPFDIVAEIIAELGRWKTSSLKATVTQTLIEFFQQTPMCQNNPTLKQTLAVALGNLESPLAQPILDRLAQDETSIVQLHAQAALKKLSLPKK